MSDTTLGGELEDERAAFLHQGLIKKTPKQERRAYIIFTICNGICFVVSLWLFSTWFYETHIQMNHGLRIVSSYSPLLDAIELPFHLTQINGTLYPPEYNPSLARRPPSPEVDTVWSEWELTRVYPVTSAQIRAMGKDPTTATKLEDSIWGLGNDAYAAILDVYHQIHCLNTLRQLIYPDYYTRPQWQHSTDPKAMFEIHMNHCVDILLQAVQCSGNVNLITLHWVEHEPFPFPDMNVNRQCVDFAALTQWRLKNTVDAEKFNETMGKPDGVKQLKAPDGYYKYFRPDLKRPNHAGEKVPYNSIEI